MDHPEVATISRTNRSRVTNGAQTFLSGDIDGRSAAARRYRDILSALLTHLGGDDVTSEARRHLARRAAALCTWCEIAEGNLVLDDENFDITEFGSAVNSLRRVLNDLGLDPTARDVTPDFRNILDASPTEHPREARRRPTAAAGGRVE